MHIQRKCLSRRKLTGLVLCNFVSSCLIPPKSEPTNPLIIMFSLKKREEDLLF